MATATESAPEQRLSILLVEDNDDDVQMFVDLISDHVSVPIDLALATTLAEAVEQSGEETFDAILLDLTLPDSEAADTYTRMHEAAQDTPIVILSGLDDESVALDALGEGVQDYLVKGKVDGSLLMRSIRYAIERNRLITQLKETTEKLNETGDKLEKADSTMAALSSIFPVCSSCKKVKAEDGTWHDLEQYIRTYTSSKVQVSLCPTCGRRFR